MIKVNYDTETTLVKGYYPDSINYTLIPEPFIEIEDDAQVLDKQMCVIDGIYQEYVMPDNLVLEELKSQKISECKNYLTNTDWQIIRLSDPTSGESLKEGVADNRALARSLQDQIKACTTLEEVNAININFQ